MKETREFLQSIGQNGGDLYDLPTSQKRFKDGAHTGLGTGFKARTMKPCLKSLIDMGYIFIV